jgi:eukaryotic-like serine/threonine-protein kinase
MMNAPHDPNATADLPSAPPDSLRAGDPLDTTDHPRGANSTVGSQPGADSTVPDLPAVSGYRVLREIARGGMGRVLAAYDLSLDREVALKILLPGANPDRFVRESKITARLPHPSIPPVHALGTLADGSPFLAMKLVVGRTLAVEMKSADPGAPGLLQAFTQVCQAVGFAHSRGVIHRDLKPANVMVGAFGEVQVMDWGLAKYLTGRERERPEDISPVAHAPGSLDANQTTDHRSANESTDGQTQAGTVLGTPKYMAPEVAAGNAATKAADVYGLGAILYTLLAGQPPYAGGTVADVLKKVTTTDPALFVEANSSVPPALVAICRTAMARNPDARYSSADDVATDVRRWLADEPVSAYREPWTARAARWARRRKTTVVAVGVLLLTVAMASSVAAFLVWREQKQTKLAWKQAEAEQIKAAENADTALIVVRDLSHYVYLAEFGGSRTDATDQQRKAALDAALADYERLLAQRPDDKEMQSYVARLNRVRANLSYFLRETADAEKFYREAKRHYEELAAAHPEDIAVRKEAALTARDFSQLIQSLGRLKDATQILDDAIGVYEELRRSDPMSSDIQRILANMLIDRADLDYQLGRFAGSEQSARRSVDLYTKLAEMPGAQPQALDRLFHGMAERWLGMALREQGRIPEAIAVFNRVVERMAAHVKLSPDRNMVSQYHIAQAERAWTFSRLPNRYAEGVAELDNAIVGLEKLSKQFPQAPVYLQWQGVGTLYRGRLKILLGQRDAAAQDLTAAATIFDGLVKKYPDIPDYRYYLGQTWTVLGQLAGNLSEAAPLYQKARDMLDGAVQRNPERFQYRQALEELNRLTKASKP